MQTLLRPDLTITITTIRDVRCKYGSNGLINKLRLLKFNAGNEPFVGMTQSFGPNVVFVNANGTSSMPIQVQQLLQQAQQQVTSTFRIA